MIRNLPREQHVNFKEPLVMFYDNKAVTQIAKI